MTDMAIGEKYVPLGNWLKEHGGDSVKLTFDELNQIIPIPNHAYEQTILGKSLKPCILLLQLDQCGICRGFH